MADYRLSNQAREDLIRIHQYGSVKFGEAQADRYFHNFFECFDLIAQRPLTFESVDHIKQGYRRCVCGVDSIFFRVHGSTIEIMTIIGRQDTNLILK